MTPNEIALLFAIGIVSGAIAIPIGNGIWKLLDTYDRRIQAEREKYRDGEARQLREVLHYMETHLHRIALVLGADSVTAETRKGEPEINTEALEINRRVLQDMQEDYIARRESTE